MAEGQNEFPRQEDGLEEIFITPTTTFASSHPLEQSLYPSALTAFMCPWPGVYSHIPISKGPGPRSAFPTENIDPIRYHISEYSLMSAHFAAGTVLGISSISLNFTTRRGNKQELAGEETESGRESHFPGYSRLWEWDDSQKIINPGPRD